MPTLPANDVTPEPARRLRIGVSACLLGSEVRFDAQHKRDRFLTEQFGKYALFVPVCPEVEVGMTVPRESVRLVRAPGDSGPRLLGSRSGADWTERMAAFAHRRVEALARHDLSGYVLKSDSPSCGLERVKLYESVAPGSSASKSGVGLFAAELQRQNPTLPIEEEGRLHDARLRDNFVERVFAYHRLHTLWGRPWTLRELITFHTAEKMALLAHSPIAYRALGQLVAAGKSIPRDELRARYEGGFMDALAHLTTPGRQANVLQHMLGHFSDALDGDDRRELLALIDEHRAGLVPLVVPITLMGHHVRRLQVPYLQGQSYLAPHPRALMLRNHV